MEHLYQLIVSAFAKFLAADLSTDRARFGLYGRWVVDASDQPEMGCKGAEVRIFSPRPIESKTRESRRKPAFSVFGAQHSLTLPILLKPRGLPIHLRGF